MHNSFLLEFDLTSNLIRFIEHLNSDTIKFDIYVNKKSNNTHFTNITIDINQNAKWEIEIFKKNISLQEIQTLVNIIISKWKNLISNTNSFKDYIFSTSILSSCCSKVFKNVKHNIYLSQIYHENKQILRYRKKIFKYFLSPNFFIFPITIFNDIDATKDKNCPIPLKLVI